MKLIIWDTAGTHIFDSVSKMVCRRADAAIVVYDITRRNSFDKAISWLKRLEWCASPNIFKALVGNKADFVKERKVKYKVICVLCSRFETGKRSAVLYYKNEFSLSIFLVAIPHFIILVDTLSHVLLIPLT